MSIIQTTATTSPGARRLPEVTPRGVPRRPARSEIPWAVMAGVRAEHAWTGSLVVLGVDDVRTDAPPWEARRTLRRMLSATALATAIAVALVWVALGVAAYASLAHLPY